MATMPLSELITAIEVALLRAQRQEHEHVRVHSVEYASDEILRLFRVPNFEMEEINVEVPVFPQELLPGTELPSTVFKVIAPRQQIASLVQVLKALRDQLGVGLADARELAKRIEIEDVVLKTTLDRAIADGVRTELQKAGMKVEILAAPRAGAERASAKAGDLVVATEPKAGLVPMIIKLKITPRPLSVVRDVDAVNTYALEAQSG